MTKANEIANNEMVDVDTTTGEIIETSPSYKIHQDTPDFTIIELKNGKFSKKMKYKPVSSFPTETEEQQMELFQLVNADSDSELITALKDVKNKTIKIKNLMTTPYESFNEDTGDVDRGVLTRFEDIDGKYYATSSKGVYFTVMNIIDTFGLPDTEKSNRALEVKVTGKKQQNGVQTLISVVGFADLKTK